MPTEQDLGKVVGEDASQSPSFLSVDYTDPGIYNIINNLGEMPHNLYYNDFTKIRFTKGSGLEKLLDSNSVSGYHYPVVNQRGVPICDVGYPLEIGNERPEGVYPTRGGGVFELAGRFTYMPMHVESNQYYVFMAEGPGNMLEYPHRYLKASSGTPVAGGKLIPDGEYGYYLFWPQATGVSVGDNVSLDPFVFKQIYHSTKIEGYVWGAGNNVIPIAGFVWPGATIATRSIQLYMTGISHKDPSVTISIYSTVSNTAIGIRSVLLKQNGATIEWPSSERFKLYMKFS